MTLDIISPQQGAVFISRALKQSGDTKPRPVVVVSINIRNQSSPTVLVVPFSSDIASSQPNAMRVFVPARVGGLDKDSYAMCDFVTTIKQQYLVGQSPYGQLTDEYIQQIQQGIQIAIGIF